MKCPPALQALRGVYMYPTPLRYRYKRRAAPTGTATLSNVKTSRRVKPCQVSRYLL